MYVRKSKYQNTTYYYLARKINQKEERVAALGSLENPDAYRESELVRFWTLQLLSGSAEAHRRTNEMEKASQKAYEKRFGRGFDLEKCFKELMAVHRKYGNITKTLLEKEARPRKEISFGVQTILKNLRKRGLSLKIVFSAIKQGESLEQIQKKSSPA